MITTDQELNNPEQLQTIEPQINEEQVQADAQAMADMPQEPVGYRS